MKELIKLTNVLVSEERGIGMENKIMWREEIIKLFPETTEKIKSEHDEWCLKCNGLGLIRENDYIVGCKACYGKGIIKACACGNKIDHKGYSICKECRDKKDQEKAKERYNRAKKINYKDYRGKFIDGDRVIDKDCFEDDLYASIENGEEYPTWVWATKKEICFNTIDIQDIIIDHCEDGYEDIQTFLDLKSEKLEEAQKLINEWEEENKEQMYCYYETNEIVLLYELIKEIKQQIKERQ